jgi:hypothetical protein
MAKLSQEEMTMNYIWLMRISGICAGDRLQVFCRRRRCKEPVGFAY